MTKHEQPRVLAYRMAKEITEEQLDEVSGGSGRMCTEKSLRVTGSGGISTMDAFLDFHLDW